MIFCIFNAYGTYYFIIHFHYLKSSSHSSKQANIEKIKKFHKPIVKIKLVWYLWQTRPALWTIYLRYYSLYILSLSYNIVDFFSYISYTNFFTILPVIFIQYSFHKADGEIILKANNINTGDNSSGWSVSLTVIIGIQQKQ